jgi:glycosyltransferase domain-containing protein
MLYIDMLSRLTLVIPTYNRQQYALRNMRYWSNKGPTIHVLDGSLKTIDTVLLRSMGNNIHYHHLPISFVERLAYVMNQIETEYAILNCDDEFFLPSALMTCIKQLDEVEEMSACGGRSISFYYKDHSVFGNQVYPLMKDHSLTQDNPLHRMVTHFGNYTQVALYSVVRTGFWKKSFAAHIKKEFALYAAAEYQFEMSIAFLGKTKIIPELMWLRSDETEPIRGLDPSWDPKNRIHHWWQNKSNKEEQEEFLQLMAEALTNESNTKIKEIKEGVAKTLDAYTIFCREYFDDNNFLRAVFNQLPVRLKITIKFFRDMLIKNTQKRDLTLLDAANELSETGVSINFEELKKIDNIVCDFHKKRIRDYGVDNQFS